MSTFPWLQPPLDQPPRGTIPASDLIVGDLIFVRGYPADLIEVYHSRFSKTSRLVWGFGDEDKMEVRSTMMVTVIGWLGPQQYA